MTSSITGGASAGCRDREETGSFHCQGGAEMNIFAMLKGALSGAMLAAGTTLVALSGAAAQAQEPFRVGVCYDLSKSYTFITPQVVQAAQDLAALVNSKGGIGGHPIELIVQDHGNEPQRGIECYERLRREGVFVF